MIAPWLAPTLVYVVLVGALGVFGKLALRSVSWQELLVLTAAAYASVAIVLLLSGKAGLSFEANTWWALAAAACTVTSLIVFYLALGNGKASTVVPITAAYPAVTLALSVLLLAESVTFAKLAGLGLVVGGVVLLTASQ